MGSWRSRDVRTLRDDNYLLPDDQRRVARVRGVVSLPVVVMNVIGDFMACTAENQQAWFWDVLHVANRPGVLSTHDLLVAVWREHKVPVGVIASSLGIEEGRFMDWLWLEKHSCHSFIDTQLEIHGKVCKWRKLGVWCPTGL